MKSPIEKRRREDENMPGTVAFPTHSYTRVLSFSRVPIACTLVPLTSLSRSEEEESMRREEVHDETRIVSDTRASLVVHLDVSSNGRSREKKRREEERRRNPLNGVSSAASLRHTRHSLRARTLGMRSEQVTNEKIADSEEAEDTTVPSK